MKILTFFILCLASAVLAQDFKTVREVESDQPNFLNRPFLLKGKIEVSSYYNWGYRGATETHYAFKIIDSSGYCDAYLERAKDAGFRQHLLDAGRPVNGLFTVVLLSDRYHNSAGPPPGLLVELLDYRFEQPK